MTTVVQLVWRAAKHLRLSLALLAVALSVITSATLMSSTVLASGEKYEWKDKGTIEGTSGQLGEFSRYFIKGAFATYPSPPAAVVEGFAYDQNFTSPIATPDGCSVLLGIQVDKNDKSKGTLKRIYDPLFSASSSSCPASYNLSTHFTPRFTIANADKADAAPSAKKTLDIRSLAPEDEGYPSTSDTITITDSKGKVIAKKEVGKADAYTTEGYVGFRIKLPVTTGPASETFQACSRALSLCSTSTSWQSLLTGPLDIFVIEIKREPVSDTAVCTTNNALGWVICPAIDLMQQTVDYVADKLDGVLRLNPLKTTGSDSIYGVWSNILNVANIMLVIAFLAVVFSQATSYGLSNYGIKRMLPRIIAAAILMNISFFICQVLVDISNILGAGVAEFVSAAAGGSFADNVREQSGTISQAVVGTAIIAIIAFFFLIPVVIAILAVFFTIAARNAIIILLVMVAPLAFAAWILPNTEKYFQKWWGLLFNMLMLYPMVMFIFAASGVAANAIATAGTGSEMQNLIALLVLAMPLFALPFLFKAAGGVLGKINDMGNRYGKQGSEFGKKQYEKTGLGREAANRKQSRETARQRRYLEGKGIGGRMASGRRRVAGVGTAGVLGRARPTSALGNQLMADQIDTAQRKLADERIDSVHRNMSGNIATGFSEGLTATEMRRQSNAGTRFTSAEDRASLEYLDRSGLSKKPDAALATAATRRLFDIENIPKSGIDPATGKETGPEIAMQNLANMVGTNQADNKRLSEEISSGASKHGYKNLSYGNVTGGTFTNYTEAGKDPLALVQGGLTGVNKDMLEDARIASAISGKVSFADAKYDKTTGKTTGTVPNTADAQRAARLEIIQQTMHINKDKSIGILAGQLSMTPDMVKAVRQSIASNGTVPMPPGF